MRYQNVELHNIEEVLDSPDGEGKVLSRIPDSLRKNLDEKSLIPPILSVRATAGAEIRFNLRGPSARISLKYVETYPPISPMVEVYHGCFFHSWYPISTSSTEIEVFRPENLEIMKRLTKKGGFRFDPGVTRVILPYWPPIRLIDIEGETYPPETHQTPEERLLVYGSSITQGVRAARPTGTYAMRLAQHLGMDLVNLGLGGGASFEAVMADYISDRSDWDLSVFEIGINILPRKNITVSEFRGRVSYFLDRIAGSNVDKWIFCIDMFSFPPDMIPGLMRQRQFRRVVREVVRSLGYPRMVYLDGRTLLRDHSGLNALDLIHPSPHGMEQIALRLSSIIKRKRKTG